MPNRARELWEKGKAILVDVREEFEVRESGIAEGAMLMPTSKMECCSEWEVFKKCLPRDKEIILYCKSGGRSARVAEILRQEGYHTSNMGGFKDWQAAQLPIKKIF